ncbi:putative peptide maturation dehydrogenase [Massilia sp. TS11]|uniref:putative peptide maturation dehydrogenase n=1 Tax=Massilia sp. TS11 TaxID=2908003 RepID=UPI001ED9D7A3|nr:putative peptide maturation dehydrogenase [Massilia sp. TS11]MCG2584858.1 putative peptide maturation dehydrogenase [Massilia sp. TS11]
MLLRRCAILFLEPREDLRFALASLLRGGSALAASVQTLAHAPHLEAPCPVDEAACAVLRTLGPSLWQEHAALAAQHGAACLDALLEQGLLISDAPAHAAWRARDEAVRAAHWRPLAALLHQDSRWRDREGENGKRFPTFAHLVERFGSPPPACSEYPQAPQLALPAPLPGPLDGVLGARYTGRNFDPQARLDLATVARLLQRSFGAQRVHPLGATAAVLKKTSPSGGGLHPIEAYLLALRVDGLAPGFYHYHPVRHTLAALGAPADPAAFALTAVAGQDWFAQAPLLVFLVGRVARSFWKYRNHPKAYRVLQLDAGHLGQSFALLAAEAGLPAFITAGINEANIEDALGLDGRGQIVLAALGCGAPAASITMPELR